MRLNKVQQLLAAWPCRWIFVQQIANRPYKQFGIPSGYQLIQPSQNQLETYFVLTKIVEARKMLIRRSAEHRDSQREHVALFWAMIWVVLPEGQRVQ